MERPLLRVEDSVFKPGDAVGLQEAARALECFWFSAARLPGLEESTG
ncbi:hypothetical protein KYC5002_42690 [Archangium violaceum]|nr:hypothetical protein KYC5002_42690 [Archangium gephyra]